MTRKHVASIVFAVVGVGLLAWALTVALERVMRPVPALEEEVAKPSAAPVPERHITAVLFYGSADAQHLVPVKREVPFGEGPVEQGRQIVVAQLTMAPSAPLISVMPAGVTLRSFYTSDKGEAFVDLGPEVVTAHTGGSAAEVLTVYALVNAVTSNLPAITRVQILVNGKEVDTLAGHVDIRRPLRRNEALVQESN